MISRLRILLLHAVIVASFAAATAGAAEVVWPKDIAVAVTLTFDLDAETVWWSDPEKMIGKPSSLSQGAYGPRVALPKILALLSKHDLRATFFIPSWVARNHPQAIEDIRSAGHEIGAHGVRHVSPDSLTPKEERRRMKESLTVLKDMTGIQPIGYRAPSWAISDSTLEIVAAAGFLYSSNLMDADKPYIHTSPAGLVELPVSWTLDDAAFFWFDDDSWNKTIHSAADVKLLWQEEFEAQYADGGFFNLTMHPQIIGRPARLKMLDELLQWMMEFDGVWITTGRQVAKHVRQTGQ